MPPVHWTPSVGGSSSGAVKAAQVLSAGMVEAPPPKAAVGSVAARHRPLRLGPFDGFNLRLWYIEATYFYEEEVDVSALRSSLSGLLARYPSFAGRARKRQSLSSENGGTDNTSCSYSSASTSSLWSGYEVVTASASSPSDASGVPLLEIAVDGSMSEAMVDSSHRDSHGFANMPDLAEAAGNGQPFSETTPLMTVTVAKFGSGGGSALAVAVSHGLVDGKGFAELMKTWSFAHEHGWDHPEVPVLVVERPDCLIDGVSTASTLSTIPAPAPAPAPAETSDNTGACVCDVRTAQGFGQHVHGFEPMIWNLAGRRRARNFFSWGEISALKSDTPCEGSQGTPTSAMRGGTPTSTEALGARIWRAFSDIVFPILTANESYSASPSLSLAAEHKVQPYLLAHMRSPRHPDISAEFLGNCVQELSGGIVDNPTDLGAICGQFRAATEMVRNKSTLATVVDAHETKIRGLKDGILLSIGSAPSADATPVHRWQLNAKQSFRVMDHAWGAGPCVGVIPVNAGADLQIIDAPGGVHIYLGCPSWASETAPSDWIESVESSAFRTAVLATHSTSATTAAASNIKFKAAAAVNETLDGASEQTVTAKPPLKNLRQLRKSLEEKVVGMPIVRTGVKKSNAFHA